MRWPNCILVLSLSGGLIGAGTAGEVAGKMVHDGKERSYILYVPQGLTKDRAVPLVIALHPYPSSGRQMADMTGLSEIGEREGFLVAYPDGLGGGYNAIMCCGAEDDVGFIRTLIAKIGEEYGIDEKRVYATGISNGGDLTYRLAAELPQLFAAIAPVSGGMTDDWMSKGHGAALPSTPVSLITFHGERDRYYDLFRRSADYWTEQKDCSPAADAPGNSDVKATTAPCKDGSEAAVYTLSQMGHSWPGGKPGGQLSDPATPIKASELLWEFFRDHPKP